MAWIGLDAELPCWYSIIGCDPTARRAAPKGYSLTRLRAECRKQGLPTTGKRPQVAARLMRPLSRWEHYDIGRQTLMRAQLARILETDDLSKDVFEIASKSIG